ALKPATVPCNTDRRPILHPTCTPDVDCILFDRPSCVHARIRNREVCPMHDVTAIDRQPNVAVDKAVLFSMRNTPLLQQGTIYDPLATAENLWVNLKVYASGGENALHSHGGEDHAFIVLQGKATFTFGDGSTAVVGQYEGVMIPKNGLYKFTADEAENLVMLPVGGGVRSR